MGRVIVDVMPKPEILDPQGKAVAGALHRLGFEQFTSVRQGKRFELEVEGEVTQEVLDAARYYADKSGRRVSIEYALIRDINDQDWRADMLGKKLHKALGSKVHVNLIPLNPTPGSKWDASPKERQDEFVRRVIAQGVPCTVRDTRGQEIAAACGQLAAEEK